MAETDPEYQVEVESGGGGLTGQTIRLVDDVFSRTCQAINDVRETVRVLAAQLIGDIRGVSKVTSAQSELKMFSVCKHPARAYIALICLILT